jgi:hypothetical protein
MRSTNSASSKDSKVYWNLTVIQYGLNVLYKTSQAWSLTALCCSSEGELHLHAGALFGGVASFCGVASLFNGVAVLGGWQLGLKPASVGEASLMGLVGDAAPGCALIRRAAAREPFRRNPPCLELLAGIRND